MSGVGAGVALEAASEAATTDPELSIFSGIWASLVGVMIDVGLMILGWVLWKGLTCVALGKRLFKNQTEARTPAPVS